ncbi:uncharacterized protein BO96DRAFT_459882 [Aspergillus niger CBS 101883]|uniref:uncharacterized protein n=1 Tax=Aspergillus lacticoffeatus (strain CBS 101883) TaxID=1450533 RepID=UPI000D7F39D6|nr:uncharacterized protein BO96DRAFT_459882 [Aspergillus niger CBS 101883]PYH52058.1 hypothetical protein BO96DRAFT_459882 [Aspergillus niger CBS 101883]
MTLDDYSVPPSRLLYDEAKPLKSLLPEDKIQCDIDGLKLTAEIMLPNGAIRLRLVDDLRTNREVLWPNFSLDDPVVAGEEMLGQFNQFNKYLKARAEALK